MKNLVKSWLRGHSNFRGLYADYEHATQASANDYNNLDLTEFVAKRTRLCADAIIEGRADLFLTEEYGRAKEINSLLFDGQGVRVLDIGGGAGLYFFLISELRKDVKSGLTWAVFETSSMLQAVGHIEDKGLRFFDHLDLAAEFLESQGQIDLIYSNASIQYMPNPVDMLRKINMIGANRLLVHRTSLTTSNKFVSVQKSELFQNGPGPIPDGAINKAIEYPITFLSLKTILRCLSRYSLVRAVPHPDSTVLLGRRSVTTFDLLFEMAPLRGKDGN